MPMWRAALFVATLVACADPISDPGDGAPPVLAVVLDSLIELGDSRPLVAVLRDDTGGTVPVEASWASSDTTVVALYLQTRRLVGVSEGRATISACASGQCDSVTLRVLRNRFLRIAPLPPLGVGETRTLAAAYVDSAGATVATATATWTVGDTTVVRVEAAPPRVTALALGAVMLRACDTLLCDSATVTTDVMIVLPSDTVVIGSSLRAELLARTPFTLPATVAWEAGASEAVTLLDTAAGLVLGTALGSGTLVADVDGRRPMARIQVDTLDALAAARARYDSVAAAHAHPLIGALGRAIPRFTSDGFTRGTAGGRAWVYDPYLPPTSGAPGAHYRWDSTRVDVPAGVVRFILFADSADGGAELGWVDVTEEEPAQDSILTVALYDPAGLTAVGTVVREADPGAGRVAAAGAFVWGALWRAEAGVQLDACTLGYCGGDEDVPTSSVHWTVVRDAPGGADTLVTGSAASLYDEALLDATVPVPPAAARPALRVRESSMGGHCGSAVRVFYINDVPVRNVGSATPVSLPTLDLCGGQRMRGLFRALAAPAMHVFLGT